MTVPLQAPATTPTNGLADAALVERVRARLDTLMVERQTALDQAQRTLAAYDGAIGELTALLAPPPERDGATLRPAQGTAHRPAQGAAATDG